MPTEIINLDSVNPDIAKIKTAAAVLQKGGLVAFPTETVYGIGANALNPQAVQRIFEVKGRPNDNPLIVHIYSNSQLADLVQQITPQAQLLIDAFWPGPLTIILKKQAAVPVEVTAGLDTVAVRRPANAIALALLKESGLPIVAPSANLSGKPSPTKGEHVVDDLNGRVECIIDGGSVEIGLESTVVDLTVVPPVILRPGKISQTQIEQVIGALGVNQHSSSKPKAPGMKYRHYSPNAQVVIIDTDSELQQIKQNYPQAKIKQLKYSNDVEMAGQLFSDFRKADKEGYTLLVVNSVAEQGLGAAIMDRLKKAADR